MSIGTTTKLELTSNQSDLEYIQYLQCLQTRFDATEGPLFDTETGDLFRIYLDSFPLEDRQYHTCRACETFLDRYGALVTIDAEGVTHSVFWNEDDAPARYKGAVAAMRERVEHSIIGGVFLSSERQWGQPITKRPTTEVWTHFAVMPSPERVYQHPNKSAYQVSAKLLEDYGILQRGLAQYTAAHVTKAVTLLESDQMYRTETATGLANWLAALYAQLATTKDDHRRSNIVWRAVANAPAGWAHFQNTVIGALLDDLKARKPFANIKRNWAAKLAPLQYQRPQAPPTAGNIAAAEKLVYQLAAAGSLFRRYARLDEIQTLWTPAPPSAPVHDGSVFGHLLPKDAPVSDAAPTTATRITWVKFRDTVLPKAQTIHYYTPVTGGYAAITAPVHADAPPILQWDLDGLRNPFCWYLYPGGSQARRWNLTAFQWVQVNAVTLQPSMWNGGFEHQGTGVLFILEGARDSVNSEMAIFPGTLKADFREIRDTIEAYSKAGKLAGEDQATACGVIFQQGKGFWGDSQFRVFVDGTPLLYALDRWD